MAAWQWEASLSRQKHLAQTAHMLPTCVLLQARGSESLQDVARLFGLPAARVLADNQGVVTDAQQALGGRSILLCGQYGE